MKAPNLLVLVGDRNVSCLIIWTHIHEQVRWGGALAAHGAGGGACHTHALTTLRRRGAGGAGGAGGLRAPSEHDCRVPAPTAPREPPPLPAASFLTIICVLFVFYHYYSLVLFYVLSSASRSHRPPCAPSAAQIIGACNYRCYAICDTCSAISYWEAAPHNTYFSFDVQILLLFMS